MHGFYVTFKKQSHWSLFYGQKSLQELEWLEKIVKEAKLWGGIVFATRINMHIAIARNTPSCRYQEPHRTKPMQYTPL